MQHVLFLDDQTPDAPLCFGPSVGVLPLCILEDLKEAVAMAKDEIQPQQLTLFVKLIR